MRIAMIGTGYVGLVSGACLSEFGHQVICVDKDAAKVANLREGVIPIFEPGLEEVVAANVKAGRLSFETDIEHAVRDGATRCSSRWARPAGAATAMPIFPMCLPPRKRSPLR